MGRLPIPKGFVTGSGKLSPDGLSFLISMKRKNSNFNIYEYKRKSLSEKFTNCDLLFQSKDNLLHPTTSRANDKFIFVGNSGVSWQGNRIETILMGEPAEDIIKPKNNPFKETLQVKVVQNRTDDIVEINLKGNFPFNVKISDINGKTLFSKKGFPGQTSLSFYTNIYPAGIYFVTVLTENKPIFTERLIIIR